MKGDIRTLDCSSYTEFIGFRVAVSLGSRCPMGSGPLVFGYNRVYGDLGFPGLVAGVWGCLWELGKCITATNLHIEPL